MSRQLWVIGDSWTDPTWGGWGWEMSWPALVSRRLGLPLVNSGRSGSGYVAVNDQGWTFPLQVDRAAGAGADAVIVWGTVNDSGRSVSQLRAAATALYQRVRVLCPGAPLLVYGPQFWDTTPWDGLPPTRDTIRAAAQAEGALFVDTLLWMQGRGDLIDPTGHPTQDGHKFLADRIERDLLWAMPPEPSPHPWHGGAVQPWVSPYTITG